MVCGLCTFSKYKIGEMYLCHSCKANYKNMKLFKTLIVIIVFGEKKDTGHICIFTFQS